MSSDSNELRLTCLVEDTVHAPDLGAEHGLSILAETNGVRLMLDTGQSALVVRNARMLNIDLGSVTDIVLSHGHYDHTGGIQAVLGKARSARIHAHPSTFDRKYVRRDDGSFRSVGCPVSLQEIGVACEAICTASEPREIQPGIWTTGEVPRTNDWEDTGGKFFVDRDGKKVEDKLDDDLSVFVEHPKGTIVLTGCAHAGIVNILDHIRKLTNEKPVYAVIGGIHLQSASGERIRKTVEAFRELDVQRIGLCHCAGMPAIRRFLAVFGDRCFEFPVATRITLDGV